MPFWIYDLQKIVVLILVVAFLMARVRGALPLYLSANATVPLLAARVAKGGPLGMARLSCFRRSAFPCPN